MKKAIVQLAVIVPTAMMLLLTGCNGEKIIFSNLNDENSRELLTKLMTDAEIPKERQDVLFQHVDQINGVFDQDELTDGFEENSIQDMKYDPYEIQEKWNALYPDFLGYNCRITAFSLFSQYIRMPEEIEPRGDAVPLDMSALREDPSALEGEENRFAAFYSDVPTTMTKETEIHADTVCEDWKNRGIQFVENDKVSLISVVFHSDIEDPSILQIGHTGLLFTGEDDALYFFEKLSFEEPYQLVKFKDRKQLCRYLMEKYDVSYDQPTAAPFILENNTFLENQ